MLSDCHKFSLCSYIPANEEYYQLLMINDSHPSGFDVASYTIEEIDSITSEYTLKNTVSLFKSQAWFKNTLNGQFHILIQLSDLDTRHWADY